MMVSDEVLEYCTARWLNLEEDEKQHWVRRVDGNKYDGYRAFMDECIAEYETKSSRRSNKNSVRETTDKLRWMGIFMGKP